MGQLGKPSKAQGLVSVHPSLPSLAMAGGKKKEDKPKQHKSTWTSLEQREWLMSQKGAYLEARIARKTAITDFWVKMFENWIEKWPFPPLTEDEIKAGDNE